MWTMKLVNSCSGQHIRMSANVLLLINKTYVPTYTIACTLLSKSHYRVRMDGEEAITWILNQKNKWF